MRAPPAGAASCAPLAVDLPKPRTLREPLGGALPPTGGRESAASSLAAGVLS